MGPLWAVSGTSGTKTLTKPASGPSCLLWPDKDPRGARRHSACAAVARGELYLIGGKTELLRAGARVGQSLHDGTTALYVSSQEGHAGCAQRLVRARAAVDVRCGAAGITPLLAAAAHGRTECVRQLLSDRADVNQQARGGSSALLLAARGGHAGCVALLLDAGIDTGLRDVGGSSAADVAAALGHAQVLKVLEPMGGRAAGGGGPGGAAGVGCAPRQKNFVKAP